MTMTGSNDGLALDDEDRLPWLEPAYDEVDDDGEVSLGRLTMFVVAGLVLASLIVGCIYLLRSSFESSDTPKIIAAPKGDFKVPAEDADAKKFQGEGDASFAASEGVERGGKIDPSRLPETPVTATSGANPDGNGKLAATAAASKITAPVSNGAGKTAATASATAKTPGGPAIQLGAYGSDAIARDAWTRLSKRFDYLANLPHSIEPVVVGGTQFYRLRAAAGKDASTLCGRLKVAGENCLVVN